MAVSSVLVLRVDVVVIFVAIGIKVMFEDCVGVVDASEIEYTADIEVSDDVEVGEAIIIPPSVVVSV